MEMIDRIEHSLESALNKLGNIPIRQTRMEDLFMGRRPKESKLGRLTRLAKVSALAEPLEWVLMPIELPLAAALYSIKAIRGSKRFLNR